MADNYGQSTSTFAHDNLVAGSKDQVTQSATLVSGTVALTRGALLGQITATGKYTVFAAGAADGSEDPSAILAETTDASGGDKVTTIYLSGEFNEATVSTNSGAVAANGYSTRSAAQQTAIKLRLQALGIILKQNMRVA
jgi:hypothetical protein